MNFTEYQNETAATAIYPCGTTIEALSYVTMGLCGEAGEIANKVKKILRDDGGAITQGKKRELADELSDCMWYMSQLASELGFSLEELAESNIAKLRDRAARGVIKGSGDNR